MKNGDSVNNTLSTFIMDNRGRNWRWKIIIAGSRRNRFNLILDNSNAKLLAQFEVQNAEILKIADQLQKRQAISDFYHAQAMQAGVVPSIRRSRPISSDDEPYYVTRPGRVISLRNSKSISSSGDSRCQSRPGCLP